MNPASPANAASLVAGLFTGSADVIFDLLDARLAGRIPFEEVQDFMHAYEEAIERILGLPAGSFTLIDDASLAHLVRLTLGVSMAAVITLEKLTKSYGSSRGIIDVDLEVELGEIFGFLGPNGAGKTTTIRTMLDLIRPSSGKAFVFGIESTADPVSIHKRVGYIPGEFALYDRLTGRQTLEYFGNLRGGVDAGLPRVPDRALRPRSVQALQGVQQGQQAEGRRDRRPPAPARAPRPRRAHVGPRPARPADLLRDAARGSRRWRDRVPELAHPVRGREGLRARRDHPRRTDREARHGRQPARPRPPPGRAAVRWPGAGRQFAEISRA